MQGLLLGEIRWPTMEDFRDRVRDRILHRIENSLPISSITIQTEDFPGHDGASVRANVALIIQQEADGGSLFHAPYVRRPQRVNGMIYNFWVPADAVMQEIEQEEQGDPLEEFDEIEIPPEIVSEVFSIGDTICIYKVPSSKRVIICFSHADPEIFGDDAEKVAEIKLTDFVIFCDARWIEEVNIQDLHLAFLKLPDDNGRCLALMNEPGFEATDGRYLTIPAATISRMGWDVGQTLYLYKNSSIRELLITDRGDMVHFRPVAEYSVHANGIMKIPMRWLYEVDIHEGHAIRPALNVGNGSLVICPDDQYHQQLYNDEPIERVGNDADFDPDAIPF